MFDPDDLDPVTACYHEAGHVVMALRLGAEVSLVSIERADDDDAFAGRTVALWRGFEERERLRRTAMVALAGPVAERHWRGEVPVLEALQAWHHDWLEVASALRRQADPGAALRAWLRDVHAAITDEVTWARLCCVADALEAHGTLDEGLLEELPIADELPSSHEPGGDEVG